MLLCLCKAFVFITFTRAASILFLIYQFQFLFHCVIAAAEDIFWKISVVVIPAKARVVPPLLFRLPATNHPWWTAANKRCKWHYIESSLFKHFLWTNILLTSRSGKLLDSSPMERKLFLFLKHQSSLNKTTVLSQESNNNFLYIWQTGFFLILFYDPKSTLFPRTWAFVALFVSVSPPRIGQRSSQWSFICSNNPNPLINLLWLFLPKMARL